MSGQLGTADKIFLMEKVEQSGAQHENDSRLENRFVGIGVRQNNRADDVD